MTHKDILKKYTLLTIQRAKNDQPLIVEKEGNQIIKSRWSLDEVSATGRRGICQKSKDPPRIRS